MAKTAAFGISCSFHTAVVAAVLIFFLSPASVYADADFTERGEVAFRQALLDMGTDLRLMCVAAHPDDEDDATLAMYRKAYGLKTFAVIATRGEGGQNEIGPELGDELGVIRTREMAAAAQIIGSELHFLDLPEFGFSKSIDETFAIWGKEETLRRMVKKIRECKPDVIITHHGRMKDHGHHQAIGSALIDAFDVAADPNVFPDQIKEGLAPWQAARLYVRAWQPGNESIEINISQFDSLRGKTYAEIAADALGVHKSQGMGFFIERYLTGRPKAFYDLIKSSDKAEVVRGSVPAPAATLLKGLFDRVEERDRVLSTTKGNDAQLAGDLTERADALFKIARDSSASVRASRAAAMAMGLEVSAAVAQPNATPGGKIEVIVHVADMGNRDATNAHVWLRPAEWLLNDTSAEMQTDLKDQFESEVRKSVPIPVDAAYTLPAAEHFKDTHARDPKFLVDATFDVSGKTIQISVPVDFDIAAPIDIEALPSKLFVRTQDSGDATVYFRVHNNGEAAATGALVLSAAPPLKLESLQIPIEFQRNDEEKIVRVPVRFQDKPPPGDYRLTAKIDGMKRSLDVLIRVAEVAIPKNARVGVVQSYDDTFMQTLAILDVPHEAITLFAPDYLDTFSTIIVDIRAYLVRADLKANNKALLDYVSRGGKVIVMYHKTFEWTPELAPYPLHIANLRVTREDAPMTLLVPEHPIFNTPNKIAATDWDGWVHERGLYFAGQWDSKYTPLIQCSDPGEEAVPGSFLVAKYGEGTYIYTALVWYRQLRELHPGALRLFANMIAN
jgi:LmbE family N-acetylglucosaminyl deacetylase